MTLAQPVEQSIYQRRLAGTGLASEEDDARMRLNSIKKRFPGLLDLRSCKDILRIRAHREWIFAQSKKAEKAKVRILQQASPLLPLTISPGFGPVRRPPL